MTLVKQAYASGDLVTPPSMQYSVSNWHTYYYGNLTDKAIFCIATSAEGLKPCVGAAAGVSVDYNRFYNNYAGGTGPWGYTDPVASQMTCPSNSHLNGTTICTCNDPYMPDSARTSCVTELYTIALRDLDTEVMPAQTLSDAYAVVATPSGKIGSGVHIELTLTVDPEEDGYNHADGQHTAPHEGSLLPKAETTGPDGRLYFDFKAPEAGGTHTVTAKCGTCANQATGKITVPGCSVDELTSLADLSASVGETPEQTDLTKKLDEGLDGYSLLTPETQAAEQCLARRIATVVGPPSTSGYEVTSTIRTYAYQEHLWEVWDRFGELKRKVAKDPSIQQRCQILITTVEGEMGMRLSGNPKKTDCTLGRKHCVRYEPATDDPKHVAKTAFDIPSYTVWGFEVLLEVNGVVNPPPSTVQKEANACGLNWGGTFGAADPIHFQLR